MSIRPGVTPLSGTHGESLVLWGMRPSSLPPPPSQASNIVEVDLTRLGLQAFAVGAVAAALAAMSGRPT